MVMLKTIPPGPTWPHKHSRGYYPTTKGDITILRARRGRHARPRPWPSPPYGPAPWEHPATSNRLFLRTVAENWYKVLTAAERLAWKNLAATVTIRNFADHLVTPTGFQLYAHYERAWCTLWYDIGGVYDPAAIPLDTGPYLPWTPPATPSNFITIQWGSRGFAFWYTGTPSKSAHYIHVIMTNRPATPGKSYPAMWATLNARVTEYPSNSGNYHASCRTDGVQPYPQPHGTFHIRVTDLDPFDPWGCSLWAPLTITI